MMNNIITERILKMIKLSDGILKWNKTLNKKAIFIERNKYNRYLYLVKEEKGYYIAFYTKNGLVEMGETFVDGFPTEKAIIQALIKNVNDRIVSLDSRKSQLLEAVDKIIVTSIQ
ncbi:MAG: hypothetical protein RR620_08655 [Clostridium sp.]